MALKDKIEAALNEARIMVLGGQVLLGFQFEAIFEPKFADLPSSLKWMNAAAVGLLIAALGLLLAPVPYHRIVTNGDATDDLHRYTTHMIAAAPLPFAICIGMDVAIVSRNILGIITGSLLTVIALILWYVVEIVKRRNNRHAEADKRMSTHEKIKTINTEARIILPGVQALLGFQFTAYLMQGFDKLPPAAKHIHFAGLIALGLAVICLMAPAAYHRIAAGGEDRPDVEIFAVWMVLGSLVPLAVGFSADLYLVLGSVAGWTNWTTSISLLSVVTMMAVWIGYPLHVRHKSCSK